MTKSSFNPSHQLARLEAVTASAANALARAERDVEWYKSAMLQKNLWARDLELRLDKANHSVFWWRLGCVLALLACATALGFRWL